MKVREEIIAKLQEKVDLRYREFHSGLCPGVEKILGVRLPEQRKIAREVIQGDWREFLKTTKNEFYEETMVEGLVIASAKMALDERLGYLREFLPKIDNWAVCDSVCASFRLKDSERAEMWNFLKDLRGSDEEFNLRFMLVMWLNHFLEDGHIAEILATVGEIKSEKYYVQMAQAWLVAEAFIKYRDQTWQFLQNNQLADSVQNKAIQKIRESYRVSAEDKELVQALRRPAAKA